MKPAAAENGTREAVRLQLTVATLDGGHEAVTVALLPARAANAAPMAAGGGEADVADDSSFEGSGAASDDSSSSDDDASSAPESEPLDVIENYQDLKAMIDDMDADADVEGAGAGADGAYSAEKELLGGAPVPALAELQIGREEAVTAAGVVQGVLEGVVVLKVTLCLPFLVSCLACSLLPVSHRQHVPVQDPHRYIQHLGSVRPGRPQALAAAWGRKLLFPLGGPAALLDGEPPDALTPAPLPARRPG
jgi:hypothetical protein